jgi:hypothetical protein
MAVNRTTDQTPRQFLQRKLVEGSNNVLSWSANFNFGYILLNLTQSSGKSDFWMILVAKDQVPKTSYVDWI